MSGLSVYGVIGWILAGIGVCLILVGVFARRIVIHSRPHCAGCGYPLSDVPSTEGQVVCPECGRSPGNATECYTMSQKCWPFFLGIILFVGSLGVPHIPTMQSGGWTAGLPMSIQVRMWATGDNRLRSRIHGSYLDGSLSTAQTLTLRSLLSKALANPETPPPLLSAAMLYFRSGMKVNPIFSENDYEIALLNGSWNARRSILVYSKREGVPQSQGLRHARRANAMDPEDQSIQSVAIEWLLWAPSDDPEDRDTILALMTEESRYTTRNTQLAFDQADPYTLQIASSLLDSDDPPTRSRALRCFEYYVRRSRNELPPEIALRVAQSIDDPDPSVRQIAIDLVQDLPESTVPFFDQRLRTITDPEVLDSLIHEIIRMDPDPAGLAPAMVEISRNDQLPLPTRLDAADAYFRIRARARVDDQPENMWPAYDALIEALVNEDYESNILIGQDFQIHCHNWTATALSRRLISEGIGPEQLTVWFNAHPAVLALINIWEPLTIDPQLADDPIQRYRQTLINASRDHARSTVIITQAADQALDLHFPNNWIQQPDP